MDLEAETRGTWRGYGPPASSGQIDVAEAIGRHTRLTRYALRRINETAAAVMPVGGGPKWRNTKENPVPESYCKAAANVPEAGMNCEKDVKIYGTN